MECGKQLPVNEYAFRCADCRKKTDLRKVKAMLECSFDTSKKEINAQNP
jgi:hypothetical protein